MFSKGEVRHSFLSSGERGNSPLKGVIFYRMMSLIGVITSLGFGVYFLFLRSGVEFIFDRVAVLAVALGCFFYSFYPKLKRKRLYQGVNVLFYAFTLQTLMAAALNAFAYEYLIALFLTIQAISFSFKDLPQTLRYIAVVIALTVVSGFSILGFTAQGWVVTLSMMITAFLMYLTVRIKLNYQRHLSIQTELLRMIIEKSEEAIFLTDFDGNIIESSRQVNEVLGYHSDELVGVCVSELREIRLTEEQEEEGVKIMLRNRFWNDEVRLMRKDGSLVMTFVSISYFKKFGREYLLYRIRDISSDYESKQAIIRAKETAETALKAKSDFLAMMSHEIRTPMNGIIGMTELLRNTELTQKQEMFINTIFNCGRDLLVIINDILDYSKIEKGIVELQEETFVMNDMVNDLLTLLGAQASAKDIALTGRIDASVPKLLQGDALRLRQVLINLIGNALKFTDQGKVHLEITSEPGGCVEHPEDANLGCYTFSVKDTGIGIPPEKLERLFDSFYQVDSSASRKYGGTGLGLAISKRIIEAMGGYISVESKVGDGSLFKFTVLLKAAQPVNLEPEAPREHGLPMNNLGDLKVLVAEDNPVNRQVVTFLLQQLGIEPVLAVNGLEACRLSQDFDIDVILMDLQMPEMDGLEATRKIIAEQAKPPQIIAMTANALAEDRLRCKSVGMVDFLPKPMLLDDLRSVLENASRSVV